LSRVECPDCGAEVPIPEDVLAGEIVTCPDCGADYEVAVGEDGVSLKPAETSGEDWGE
jgi:alpha-aminoadipate carrier protein LysW